MMVDPHQDVGDIGISNKYISVVVKLENETNIRGNISTVKLCATDINKCAIGQAHNNPIMDTQ